MESPGGLPRQSRASELPSATVEQLFEAFSAIRPDLVDDLHTADGLPEEQGQHTHVQTNVRFSAQSDCPAASRGAERGRHSDHAGHGQAHKQMGTDMNKLAVVQISDRHASQSPKGHHSEKQRCPSGNDAGQTLPETSCLRCSGCSRAGLLGFDAQIKGSTPYGQQGPTPLMDEKKLRLKGSVASIERRGLDSPERLGVRRSLAVSMQEVAATCEQHGHPEFIAGLD